MRRFARFASLPALAVALTATGVVAVEHPAAADPTSPVDPGYGTGGTAVVAQSDTDARAVALSDAVDSQGRVYVLEVGGAKVRRLDAEGHLDGTFGDGGVLALPEGFHGYRLAPIGDGVLVGGSDATTGSAVLRLADDGTLVDGWGAHGKIGVSFGTGAELKALAVGSDGTGVLSLDGYDHQGDDFRLVRFDADGHFVDQFDGDATEEEGAGVYPDGLAIDAQGRVVVATLTVEPSQDPDQQPSYHGDVRRLTAAGELDQSFGDHGAVQLGAGGAVAVAASPDGDLVLGGAFGGQATQAAVWRLHADGSFDRTFGSSGISVLPEGAAVYDLGLLPDGEVAASVLTGQDHQPVVLRPDGAVESAFSAATGTRVQPWDGLGVDAQGRIYVIDTSTFTPPYSTTVRRYSTSALPSVTPSIGSVTPRREALSVTWAASEVPVGGTVRGYLLLALDSKGAAAGAAYVAGDVREATITGLVDGKPYLVTVIPVTDRGLMRASEQVGTAPLASADAARPAAAPGAATATPGHGSATIAWAPPTDDGGSPIAAYSVAVVRHDTGALAGWRNVAADARTASFPLTDGVAYDAYVMAVNGTGFGTPTAAVAVTPTAGSAQPAAPTLPWATASAPASGSSAHVAWGAATEHGAATNGYHVLVLRDGVLVQWKVAGPDQRSLDVPIGTGGNVDVYVAPSSGTSLGSLTGPIRVRSDGSLPTTG